MAEEVPARGSILGKCLPARYILAILGSIGMAIIYGLKVNLSVAMVAMVNHTAVANLNSNSDPANVTSVTKLLPNILEHNPIELDLNSTSPIIGNLTDALLNITGTISPTLADSLDINPTSAKIANLAEFFTTTTTPITPIASHPEECTSPDADTKPENGPFIWSTKLQGFLLSCYFLGYFVSQIPGAHVAENFSAKWVMFFSVAINVVCTLLTPPLTKWGYGGLILMRILEGVGGGATFPAMHCMIASWAPPSERSVMSTIIYVGTSFGTAVSILLAGVLSAKFGWEAIFYYMGGLSCIWMVLWAILVQDNPNKQRFISQEERLMITTALGTVQLSGAPVKEEHPPVPWRSVLTSVPFWAILIAHMCSNWGWYMFLIEIPAYMKQVLHFNVSKNAANSAAPFFPMLIFSIILGKTLDTLKAKQKITTTIARKSATGIASVIPAICLLVLCYIGCKHTAAVIIMAIGVIAMGGMFSGFLSNHIDIAPNYAGTLVALTNTVATIPGIIVPMFVGWITDGNQNIGAWRIIFFVTIVLFAIEFCIFTIFGSGEEQSWNKSHTQHGIEHGTTEATPLKAQSPKNGGH